MLRHCSQVVVDLLEYVAWSKLRILKLRLSFESVSKVSNGFFFQFIKNIFYICWLTVSRNHHEKLCKRSEMKQDRLLLHVFTLHCPQYVRLPSIPFNILDRCCPQTFVNTGTSLSPVREIGAFASIIAHL